MSTSPALTVAMSVYNGERFLAEAIESVLGQTFAGFEFLIVDDGSSDGSSAIKRENRGLVASLNELLAAARAPLIARMDADDISRPERFARQIAFLAEHRDHGVVGSLTSDIDETGQPFPLQTDEHPLSHDQLLRNIATGGPLLAHPSVMYRREVVLAAGGYHAAYRHCEDYDLWLRLAHQTRIANLPERLIDYRHYSAQVSNRHALEQQFGVAVARLAFQERAAGRADPTEHLERLPPLGDLDALFGRPGVDRAVRAHVARALVYSPSALRGRGFELLLQHIGEGGGGGDLWRTVPRLVRFGEPRRALRLAAALTRG
jgi:hypothetical protein